MHSFSELLILFCESVQLKTVSMCFGNSSPSPSVPCRTVPDDSPFSYFGFVFVGVLCLWVVRLFVCFCLLLLLFVFWWFIGGGSRVFFAPSSTDDSLYLN